MTDRLLSSLAPVPAPPTLVPRVLAAVAALADDDAGGVAAAAPDAYVVRPSPIGDVLVAYNDRGISACIALAEGGVAAAVAAFRSRFGRDVVAGTAPSPALVDRIDRALAGERVPSLSYDLASLTGFARAVLDKAAEIPAGQVRSYGWVAAEIGRPKAVRAVGTALGHNPVPLLIPCHRVVRTDGRIGDYAFGSPAKRAVLTAEGADPEALERLAGRGVRFVASATTGIFCHPTCAAARRITDRHRVLLRSAGAAEAAGYRPCRICRPVPAALLAR